MYIISDEEALVVSGGDGYAAFGVGAGCITGSVVIGGSAVVYGGAVAGMGAGGAVTGVGAVPVLCCALAAYGGWLIGSSLANTTGGQTATTAVANGVSAVLDATGWSYVVNPILELFPG